MKKQQPYLDPFDRMRLEAAREKNSERPTVSVYNDLVRKNQIYGKSIRQFGIPDNRT